MYARRWTRRIFWPTTIWNSSSIYSRTIFVLPCCSHNPTQRQPLALVVRPHILFHFLTFPSDFQCFIDTVMSNMSLSRVPMPSIALVLTSNRPPLPSRLSVIKSEFDPLQTIYPVGFWWITTFVVRIRLAFNSFQLQFKLGNTDNKKMTSRMPERRSLKKGLLLRVDQDRMVWLVMLCWRCVLFSCSLVR